MKTSLAELASHLSARCGPLERMRKGSSDFTVVSPDGKGDLLKAFRAVGWRRLDADVTAALENGGYVSISSTERVRVGYSRQRLETELKGYAVVSLAFADDSRREATQDEKYGVRRELLKSGVLHATEVEALQSGRPYTAHLPVYGNITLQLGRS